MITYFLYYSLTTHNCLPRLALLTMLQSFQLRLRIQKFRPQGHTSGVVLCAQPPGASVQKSRERSCKVQVEHTFPRAMLRTRHGPFLPTFETRTVCSKVCKFAPVLGAPSFGAALPSRGERANASCRGQPIHGAYFLLPNLAHLDPGSLHLAGSALAAWTCKAVLLQTLMRLDCSPSFSSLPGAGSAACTTTAWVC